MKNNKIKLTILISILLLIGLYIYIYINNSKNSDIIEINNNNLFIEKTNINFNSLSQKMNKIYKIFFVLIYLIISQLILTNAIIVNNNSTITNNCDEANVDEHYYIPNNVNSITIYPVDTISNIDKPIFIGNGETSVSL
ncbi:MAG: hypothetical protein Q9M97_03870 [Candidatus Gracilibacteria bacterium]|nr:hypothetical protein [Candidatus Gracilibacteria bacterium]